MSDLSHELVLQQPPVLSAIVSETVKNPVIYVRVVKTDNINALSDTERNKFYHFTTTTFEFTLLKCSVFIFL